MCPVIKLWLHLKRKHHFDHNVPSDYMVITFEKKTAQKTVGSLWKKTLVSFTILFTMYPLWIWATHWDFFHKILYNVITMYPTIYSKSSLRVCGKTEPQCNFFEISLQRNLWGHCDYIAEYFMKELSMSGSDLEWIHCEKNCERNQGFLSQRTHCFLCCFLFKYNHHVITGYIVIKVVFFFQM